MTIPIEELDLYRDENGSIRAGTLELRTRRAEKLGTNVGEYSNKLAIAELKRFCREREQRSS